MYKLKSDLQKILYLREAGAVQRLHTVLHVGSYDIAQHSFNILTMLRVLNPEASRTLIWACVGHDLAERLTGDIPATMKWFMRGTDFVVHLEKVEEEILSDLGFNSEISNDEQCWLKALDITELYLWVREQRSMGNTRFLSMEERIVDYFFSKDYFPEEVKMFFKQAMSSDFETALELGETNA